MSWASVVLSKSPAGWWRLGEASSIPSPYVAEDSSGNNRDGNYNNVTLEQTGSVTGDSDKAMLAFLSASSGYMSVPSNAAFSPGTGDFSILIAFKSDASGVAVAVGRIASNAAGANYWLGLNSGKATFSVNGQSAASAGNFNDNAWHLAIGVRQGTSLKLYVDNVLVGTGTLPSNENVNPSGALGVGTFGDYGISGGGNSLDWAKLLDEAAYFPSALTVDDVADLYAAWTNAVATLSVAETSVDPHTAGITLTLSATVIDLDAAVLGDFSVDLGTLTAYNSGTHELTYTSPAAAGTATLTFDDGVDTADDTFAVADRKTILASAPGGTPYTVIEPAAYDGSSPVEAVAYVGGRGEDRDAWDDDALKSDTRDALLAAGYVLFAFSAGTTHWGNDAGLAKADDAYNDFLSDWNILSVTLDAQSMGGLLAGRMLADPDTFPKIKGAYFVYPIFDVLSAWTANAGWRTEIQTAWGASDEPTLTAAVAGVHPIDIPAADFSNIGYRCVASASDVVAVKSENTDAMRTKWGTTDTRENSLLAATGDHGDASHFDEADNVANMDEWHAQVPVLTQPVIPSAGTTLTAKLSVAGCTPTSGTGGFTLSGTSATPGAWTVSGRDITVALSPAAQQGETVTYSYSRASTTDDVEDFAGLFLANFSGASVTNNSTATGPAPDLSVTVSGGGSVADGGTDALGTRERLATVTRSYTITNDGDAAATLGTVTAGTGLTITANPSGTTIAAGGTATLTVSVDTSDEGSINAAVSIPSDDATTPYNWTVTATVTDTTAPVLQRIEASGSTVTLIYDEVLDVGSVPDPSDYAFANGKSVTGVAISSARVLLTVSPAYTAGDAGGRLAYVDGVNPVQDAAGNAAAAFGSIEVFNEGPGGGLIRVLQQRRRIAATNALRRRRGR